MAQRPLIIAIDGPSGAGKGTVARTVAARLGYPYVDTGAMYRAVAWKALRDNVDLTNGAAVADVARGSSFDLSGGTRIDGHEVTSAIRTPAIDDAAAIVSRHPEVRAVLVERQRRYSAPGGLVMEGRDIGSVVFPNADVKFYLDALPEERARRRATDPAHTRAEAARGVEHVAQALEARDRSDRTRPVSPLLRADDAIYIDTTGVAMEDVVRRVLEIVEARSK
jgi:cytidylate kinase